MIKYNLTLDAYDTMIKLLVLIILYSLDLSQGKLYLKYHYFWSEVLQINDNYIL